MYDLIVVGAGPAGLTSALYSARAGKKVLLLESNAYGGQIATSPRVENYPSVLEISGSQLADRMFEQAMAHGVEFDMGTAVVEEDGETFKVVTEYGEYRTKSVILATGVKHKHLGLINEEKFNGKGVGYCAVCDGAFYANQEVAVVGDANSAVQYALFLSGICSKVYLLTLFDRLFCDDELAQRLKANDKIEWIRCVSVADIVGSSHVEGVTLKESDGATTYLDCNAVFIAIGQQPDNGQFAHLVDLDDKGFIVAGEDCKTSHKGIFVAGDCRTKSVRQCATAVGDGAVASVQACAYVDSLAK